VRLDVTGNKQALHTLAARNQNLAGENLDRLYVDDVVTLSYAEIQQAVKDGWIKAEAQERSRRGNQYYIAGWYKAAGPAGRPRITIGKLPAGAQDTSSSAALHLHEFSHHVVAAIKAHLVRNHDP
jgi:hypothetical protein